MRLRKHLHQSSCEVNIAPLIDVVFLLIIFFMVVSQFTRVEVEALTLPEAGQGESPDTQRQRLIVNIHPDGRTLVAGTPYTAETFERFLKNELTKRPADKITVLIRADRQTAWKYVSQIMEVCGTCGIERVRVAVIDKPGKIYEL